MKWKLHEGPSRHQNSRLRQLVAKMFWLLEVKTKILSTDGNLICVGVLLLAFPPFNQVMAFLPDDKQTQLCVSAISLSKRRETQGVFFAFDSQLRERNPTASKWKKSVHFFFLHKTFYFMKDEKIPWHFDMKTIMTNKNTGIQTIMTNENKGIQTILTKKNKAFKQLWQRKTRAIHALWNIFDWKKTNVKKWSNEWAFWQKICGAMS